MLKKVFTFLLPFILITSCVGTENIKKIDILISTDCGVDVDDQFMITHLASLEDYINIKAIFSTHFGNRIKSENYNTEAVISLSEINKVLGLIQKDTIPTYLGSSIPLSNKKSIHHLSANNLLKITEKYSKENNSNQIIA